MTLDSLEPGIEARILRVNWALLAEDEGKRLKALGVDEGADLSILHRGVFGGRDPLAIRLGAMTVALRRSHALAIEVQTA